MEEQPPAFDKPSIMDMPSMSGVKLNMQASRRSSMFDKQPRSMHGTTETNSRGTFSLKGIVDPAVALKDKSQESDGSSASSGSKVRLSTLPDVPHELVRQTKSEDSLDSQAIRQKNMAPQYENTYRLEPDAKPTRKELTDVLNTVIDGVTPEQMKCEDFTRCVKIGQDMANRVLAACHEIGLKRYRFLCNVTTISRQGASAQQASRQLWDHNRDTWDEASLKLAGALVFLQLYCIYLD